MRLDNRKIGILGISVRLFRDDPGDLVLDLHARLPNRVNLVDRL